MAGVKLPNQHYVLSDVISFHCDWAEAEVERFLKGADVWNTYHQQTLKISSLNSSESPFVTELCRDGGALTSDSGSIGLGRRFG